MPVYTIERRADTYATIEIEADSFDEAARKMRVIDEGKDLTSWSYTTDYDSAVTCNVWIEEERRDAPDFRRFLDSESGKIP